MVVIEFDLPRSVSLSALDDNNVTLKDVPENSGQETDKMVPRGTLICRPNSHPFQERYLVFDAAVKVGRSVARVKPALNNAIFDCKVLSRNHALLWYKEGKFYLQDTKSSNGTFVNNQRLSKGSEESAPREVCSGDIVQFGVDVMENSRKVTHGCIVATLKLYLPDGKEAKASPSTGIQDENEVSELGKQDLYQLNQWIQEAVLREQVLETKLGTLQRIVGATREAAELGWTALMEEDRLLTRIESLENQLVVCSKNFNEDKLREEIRKLYDEKNVYQDVAKESLRKVLTEKMETLKKLQQTERSLSNAEDERDSMKEMNDKLNQQVLELADKYQKETEELSECKKKLEDADNLQRRLEQEIEIRQDIFREAKAKETVLLAQVESHQAEVDFTKEQLANLRLRLESVKVAELANHDKEELLPLDSHKIHEEATEAKSGEEENQVESLKQRIATLESQLEAERRKTSNGEHIEDPIGIEINQIKRLQELLDESREKCRQLEDEADKRASEAQDGWALAAQLQQYFRNLNNLLVDAQSDAEIVIDDGDDDEEPSQLAVKINGRIASLRKDYNSCQSVNKNNNETIEQLTGRLHCIEAELLNRKNQEQAEHDSTCLLEQEIARLNLHLREVEESRQEILEERYKWKCAYEELVEENENRKASVEKLVTACPVDSALVDPECVTPYQPQLTETLAELETLKRRFESVQSEKKELEAEFVELKENYSLLSSQSKTVGRWMYMVPLAVLVLAVLIAFRPAD